MPADSDRDVRKVFQIPTVLLEMVQHKVELLNRKARKLGVPEVRLEVLGDCTIHYEFPGEDYWSRKIAGKEVYLEGAPIRLPGGWRLLAIKEYLAGAATPLVTRIDPELSIPRHYYTSDATCDHCKEKRDRRQTFVLQNDQGQYVQVGRTCLKDFLGHDPTNAMAYSDALQKLDGSLEDLDVWANDKVRAAAGMDLLPFLQLAAQLVLETGYVKSGAMDDRGRPLESTADAVWQIMDEAASGKVKKPAITPQAEALAKAALEFARGEASGRGHSSDYWFNLASVIDMGYVVRKSKGLIASIIPAYQRELAKRAKEEQKVKLGAGEYLGAEGAKLKGLRLQLQRVITIDGNYGTTFLLIFSDPDGHAVKWFSSRGSDKNNKSWEQGAWYTGTATVKKCEEYRGEKQTVITRATLQQGTSSEPTTIGKPSTQSTRLRKDEHVYQDRGGGDDPDAAWIAEVWRYDPIEHRNRWMRVSIEASKKEAVARIMEERERPGFGREPAREDL